MQCRLLEGRLEEPSQCCMSPDRAFIDSVNNDFPAGSKESMMGILKAGRRCRSWVAAVN